MAIYELNDIDLDAVSAGTGSSKTIKKINAIQVNNAAQAAAAVSILSKNDGSANNVADQSNSISQ